MYQLLLIFLLSISFRAGALVDLNQMVLDAVASMPKGGGYSVKPEAFEALRKSISIVDGQLKIDAAQGKPSFCTSATYLVFLKVISALQRAGYHFDPEAIELLRVSGQPDGTDSWGRWNSNGPGTARYFYEISAGKNIVDWSLARPGDFMKIFWNSSIGKDERGHSVVYLGTVWKNGVEQVKYWSSNQANGMGVALIDKSKVIRAVFSRLIDPAQLNSLVQMPKSDPYLSSLLTTASNWKELLKKIGLGRAY